MSLLVDTKSGAGFDTGLDFYLRTSSRGEEDSLMTSQSGADPGMLEAPRTGVRGGYGGGYRGLWKNNNKWLQQCQCYASSLSNFLLLLRINFAQFHPKEVVEYETYIRFCYFSWKMLAYQDLQLNRTEKLLNLKVLIFRNWFISRLKHSLKISLMWSCYCRGGWR